MLTYGFTFLLRSFGGLRYQPLNGITITFFIGSFISFVLGYHTFKVVTNGHSRCVTTATQKQTQESIDSLLLKKIILLCVAWLFLSVLDLYSLRSFYESGFTESRYLRMAEGIRGSITGILTSFLEGFPMMAIAYVFLKKDEIDFTKTTKMVIGFYIASVAISFSSGGRNSAAFQIIFLLLTGLLRKAGNKRAFPILPKALKFIFGVTFIFCLLLSAYLFVSREEMRGRDVTLVIGNLTYYFDIDIQTNFLSNYPSLQIVYSMLVFYITHSINQLNIMITSMAEVHYYYGGYNFYKVVLLLNKFGLNLPDITSILGDMDQSGVYIGLLGSLYLDFGYIGTFIFLFLYGLFVKMSWVYALHSRKIEWELLAIFNFLVIIFAPIYSVFNIASGFSFLIAICFVFLFRRKVVF